MEHIEKAVENLESILKNIIPELYGIKEIKPYEKNAKLHDETQINNVAESIKQFGFVQPIVIDNKNEIIIGHCRYEASKKLKLDKVPCVKVDLPEDKVKELRLLDNKLNESAWDFSLLAEDKTGLEFDGFDIDWGISEISEEDIDKFFMDSEETIKEPKTIKCPHCGEIIEL